MGGCEQLGELAADLRRCAQIKEQSQILDLRSQSQPPLGRLANYEKAVSNGAETMSIRRLMLRLGVALAAFAVGCGVFLLSQPFRGLSCRVSDPPLPYCEVARNADRYHNKNIRVRARIIFGSNGVYLFEHCDPVEALASSVVLGEDAKTDGIDYVQNLLVTDDKSHLRTGEALIEGHFNGKATTGCWAPKFSINAKRIELLSEITEYKPPHSATER